MKTTFQSGFETAIGAKDRLVLTEKELAELKKEMWGGVGIGSFEYCSDDQLSHLQDKPFVVIPPCAMKHPDGSVSHFVWESSLYPERDTSEKVLELFEKNGHVVVLESLYTKQPDIVL